MATTGRWTDEDYGVCMELVQNNLRGTVDDLGTLTTARVQSAQIKRLVSGPAPAADGQKIRTAGLGQKVGREGLRLGKPALS